jgi:hypothetical protein
MTTIQLSTKELEYVKALIKISEDSKQQVQGYLGGLAHTNDIKKWSFNLDKGTLTETQENEQPSI